MITSFRSKPLRAYFETGKPGKLPVQGAAVARVGRILRALDVATKPEDMTLPGWYFHGLEGQPADKPRWSVRVTGNWRVTFGWGGADATDVDLEDYH